MNDEQRTWLKFTYAWNWFSYHASQRLQAFNFYLIIMGAFAYSYSSLLNKQIFKADRIFYIFFFAVSFLFLLLEIRNAHLVDCGRDALDKLESDLELLGTPYAIRERDKLRKNDLVNHKFVIRFIYVAVMIISLLFACAIV